MDITLKRRVATSSFVAAVLIVILLVAAGTVPGQEQVATAGGLPAPTGLMFLRNPAQSAELWRADANGDNQVPLALDVTTFSPSPDGTKVVYAMQPRGMPSKIELVDVRTNAKTVMAWEQDFMAFSPLWSPADGPGIIVYERRAINPDGLGAPRLWLIQEDGSDLGPVIQGGDIITYGAHWSPDGTRLALTDPLRNEIVIYNFSEQLRRVPYNGEFDWSPDGQKLVISAPSEGDSFNTRLVIYDLATDQAQVIFASEGDQDYTPRWSPDGRSIAFVRRAQANPRGTIWIGDLASGTAQAITVQEPGGEPFDDVDPQWAPDGRALIWTRLSLGSAGVPVSLWRHDIGADKAPRLFIENAVQPRWLK